MHFTSQFRLRSARIYNSALKLSIRSISEGAHQTALDIPKSLKPQTYTSGHCLMQDREQQAIRHVDFDFEALCRRVLEINPLAQRITKYEKKEGSFNRAFILHLDTGDRVVARIPFPIAGPPKQTLSSEVATLAYIRSNTNIPVPKVLDWSDDHTNIYGTEYMIMEHAPGIQLAELWPKLNIAERFKCTKALCGLIGEMSKLKFPAYGSLYFAGAPIEESSKIALSDEICIGPHCGAPVWPCNPTELKHYDDSLSRRGPWTNLGSYATGLVDAAIAQLPKDGSDIERLEYQGSVLQHTELLAICRDVIAKLVEFPAVQSISDPFLLHPDLNQRNIFVSEEDAGTITAVIDWQSSSINPTFWYVSETPDLIAPSLELAAIMEGEGSTEEEKNDPRIKSEQENLEILQKLYGLSILRQAPKLGEASNADATLYRIMEYCASSWRLSATMLRQELIDLSKQWKDLGLPGECPYQPTEKELKKQEEMFDDFESYQQMKMYLTGLLNCNSEGWVSKDIWEIAKEGNVDAYDQWIQSATMKVIICLGRRQSYYIHLILIYRHWFQHV